MAAVVCMSCTFSVILVRQSTMMLLIIQRGNQPRLPDEVQVIYRPNRLALHCGILANTNTHRKLAGLRLLVIQITILPLERSIAFSNKHNWRSQIEVIDMHRFLIVIEKAEGNYWPTRLIFPAAWRQVKLVTRLLATCMQQSKCMYAAYWKTACRCLNLIRLPNISLYRCEIQGQKANLPSPRIAHASWYTLR